MLMLERLRINGLSRRTSVIGSVAAAAVLVSATAYGFVSARSTSGTGQISTGAPLQNLEVVGPSNITLNLDQPVALSGTFINENTFRVSIRRVTVSINGILAGPGVCNINTSGPNADFVLTPAVPAGGSFTATGAKPITGSGTGDWSGATIEFRNSPTRDQSGCLNRRINLRYTAEAFPA
jgi:hypothetical protein